MPKEYGELTQKQFSEFIGNAPEQGVSGRLLCPVGSTLCGLHCVIWSDRWFSDFDPATAEANKPAYGDLVPKNGWISISTDQS